MVEKFLPQIATQEFDVSLEKKKTPLRPQNKIMKLHLCFKAILLNLPRKIMNIKFVPQFLILKSISFPNLLFL